MRLPASAWMVAGATNAPLCPLLSHNGTLMRDPRPAGGFLKRLNAAEYARLSALLDESLDMLPGERTAWLARVQRSDPQSAAVLRNMFAFQYACQAERFLESLPLPRRYATALLH
jgi:hypothetical protein